VIMKWILPSNHPGNWQFPNGWKNENSERLRPGEYIGVQTVVFSSVRINWIRAFKRLLPEFIFPIPVY